MDYRCKYCFLQLDRMINISNLVTFKPYFCFNDFTKLYGHYGNLFVFQSKFTFLINVVSQQAIIEK